MHIKRLDGRTGNVLVSRVKDTELKMHGRPNLALHCKRFATASTSTQVLPLRYVAQMSVATSYTLRQSTDKP